jgi:DNA processing protein
MGLPALPLRCKTGRRAASAAMGVTGTFSMMANSQSGFGRDWNAASFSGPPFALAPAEKSAWLRLLRTPNIGPVTFWELLAFFGSAEAALNGLPALMGASGRISAKNVPDKSEIGQELENASSAGMTLLARGEPGYPPLLAQIEVPPPLIYMKGHPEIWQRPPLAIVGSRRASAAGLKFAGELAGALAGQGFLIVSGLARGIDSAAHQAALFHGTCAVLPGGLDKVYPPEHEGLAREITGNGLLIGEGPPGFTARSQDFPRRNRIISGCSFGVVIVEAAERSGSLITARLAAEQNREVFAVPGHPYDLRAAGTNRLIKDGAIITLGPQDIIEVLGPMLEGFERSVREPACSAKPQPGLDASLSSVLGSGNEALNPAGSALETIVNLLTVSPTDVDEICRLSGLPAREVCAALLMLDLDGRIERWGLRRVALRP